MISADKEVTDGVESGELVCFAIDAIIPDSGFEAICALIFIVMFYTRRGARITHRNRSEESGIGRPDLSRAVSVR